MLNSLKNNWAKINILKVSSYAKENTQSFRRTRKHW
jgi:hypothetical protein